MKIKSLKWRNGWGKEIDRCGVMIFQKGFMFSSIFVGYR